MVCYRNIPGTRDCCNTSVQRSHGRELRKTSDRPEVPVLAYSAVVGITPYPPRAIHMRKVMQRGVGNGRDTNKGKDTV